MTAIPVPGIYHTGIIVDDLAAAMGSYSAALGLEWVDPVPTCLPVHTRAGLRPRLSWVTYSTEGPHRIELIEHVDPTAWLEATNGPRVHHLGRWVDDLESEQRRLESLGFEAEVWTESPAGTPAGISYHKDPNGGLNIELVDQQLRPMLETWWSTGDAATVPGPFKALGLDPNDARLAFERRHELPRPGGPVQDS